MRARKWPRPSEEMMAVREVVTKALEEARNEKIIEQEPGGGRLP